jgi:hypothetical protein
MSECAAKPGEFTQKGRQITYTCNQEFGGLAFSREWEPLRGENTSLKNLVAAQLTVVQGGVEHTREESAVNRGDGPESAKSL